MIDNMLYLTKHLASTILNNLKFMYFIWGFIQQTCFLCKNFHLLGIQDTSVPFWFWTYFILNHIYKFFVFLFIHDVRWLCFIFYDKLLNCFEFTSVHKINWFFWKIFLFIFWILRRSGTFYFFYYVSTKAFWSNNLTFSKPNWIETFDNL